MEKRVVGGAIIVAATLLVYQPQKIMEDDQSVFQDESHKSHALAGEEANMAPAQMPITLVETIDGDTIKVKVNGKVETIRYLLIDTPESRKPDMCVQPFAKEAYLSNNELVRGGRLSLEFEDGNTRDAYGRLLAYVYVDGVSVQEMLLKEGYARVAYIMDPPYKYLKRYRTVENLAKGIKVRIWSTKGYVTSRGFNGCVNEWETEKSESQNRSFYGK